MVTLNCTLKLAKRLPFSMVETTLPTTNRLGDWSANSFNVGRFPYLIITNQRTLFSVVLPFKEGRTFWPRFLVSLEPLLQFAGLPHEAIQRELEEYRQVQLTRKTNRQTLGSMNDFVNLVRARYEIDANPSLIEINRDLTDVPCGPLKYGNPKEAVQQVLLSAAARKE